MAVRFILGIDHLGSPSGNVTSWLGALPISAFLVGGSSKSTSLVAGSLTCLNTTGSDQFYFTLQTIGLMTAGTPKAVWGARVSVVGGSYGSVGASPIVYAGSNGAQSGISIFTPADLPGYPNLATKSYYLEFSFDYTTGQIERWVDNVKISSFQTSMANVNAIGRGMTIGFCASLMASQQFFWRDMYWLEDTSALNDGLPSWRLGPQTVVPIKHTVAVGASWTKTTGPGLIDDLNSPITATAGTVASPTVQVAASATPMTLSSPTGQDNIPDGSAISGVCSYYGGASGTGHAISITQDVGGVQNPASVAVPASSLTQGYRTPVQSKAPGGVPWTKANLAQLKNIVQQL